MGMIRKEWDCCGSVTETEAWVPSECPFCELSKQLTKMNQTIININEVIEDLVVNGGFIHIFNPEFSDADQSVYQVTGHDLVVAIEKILDLGKMISEIE